MYQWWPVREPLSSSSWCRTPAGLIRREEFPGNARGRLTESGTLGDVANVEQVVRHQLDQVRDASHKPAR